MSQTRLLKAQGVRARSFAIDGVAATYSNRRFIVEDRVRLFAVFIRCFAANLPTGKAWGLLCARQRRMLKRAWKEGVRCV